MSVLREENPKAAKRHTCIWCSEEIKKGEKHRLQAGIVEGEFQTNRYHEECWGAVVEDWHNGGDCDFEEGSHKRGTVNSA